VILALISSFSRALAFNYLLDLWWVFQISLKFTALALLCGLVYQVLTNPEKL
jgi:hypothetical protein